MSGDCTYRAVKWMGGLGNDAHWPRRGAAMRAERLTTPATVESREAVEVEVTSNPRGEREHSRALFGQRMPEAHRVERRVSALSLQQLAM